LELEYYTEEKLPSSSVPGISPDEQPEVGPMLAKLAKERHIRRANVAFPEARGYLFEAAVEGENIQEWCTGIEQRLDEYVPLPPAEVAFDAVPFLKEGSKMNLIGLGCARRVVDDTIARFDAAGISVRSLESEMFALPRALLPRGDKETVLIVDIGKMSTKLLIVSNRLPRMATTLDIGGHALTLAVQKYFGVTEDEARQVKIEQGLVAGTNSEEYITAMLSTVSVIREELLRRIDYWDTRKSSIAGYESISRTILVGRNANLRGLPEYLETALKMPVELGDVFVNFAPRSQWVPSIDYLDSLGFGTAIGLALRDYM
jgi:type IV pilus assembly protein PilM